MRVLPRVLVAAAVLALAQCSAGAAPRQPAAPTGGGPAVLFIGNSLTEANDLPHRVQEIAGDAGAALEVAAVVAGGFSLGDHLASGGAVARIRSRAWSAVVMQQGPSTLPESRVALIRDAGALAAEARAAGARPALLAVWPLPGQRQEDVSASYRAAAEATGSLLVPAGDAWQAARTRDASLRFTVADGFHPSPLGTYLAALSVYCALNGSLPPAPALAVERGRTGIDLSAGQSLLLRESACAARQGGGDTTSGGDTSRTAVSSARAVPCCATSLRR